MRAQKKHSKLKFLPLCCPLFTSLCLIFTCTGLRQWPNSLGMSLAALFAAALFLILTGIVVGLIVADYNTLDGILRDIPTPKRSRIARRGFLEDALKALLDYQAQQYRSDILYRQAEANALQNQINPHFLYNTLESIRGHALVENCSSIADMAEALSSMFRYSISAGEMITTIRAELENVSHYVYIQKYRFGNRFSLRQQVEYDSLMDTSIPKLLHILRMDVHRRARALRQQLQTEHVVKMVIGQQNRAKLPSRTNNAARERLIRRI